MARVSGCVRRYGWRVVSVVSAMVCCCMTASGASGSRAGNAPGSTDRVSVGATGSQASGDSVTGDRSISADGRYVVFMSDAANLVRPHEKYLIEVFVRDRVAHTTRLISVSTSGLQGDGNSPEASISSDGRFVAFDSEASNLVPGDHRFEDVFVRNRLAHTTRLVSVTPKGRHGNGDSMEPSISAHGRFIAFTSWAADLAPGLTSNRDRVFVRDRVAHTTRRVSVPTGGGPINNVAYEPSISADGRFVAFASPATNLVAGAQGGVFVHDRARHTTRLISVGRSGKPANNVSIEPSISADGRYVAFVSNGSNLVRGDTNNTYDVFVRDRVTHTTRRVSINTKGHQTSEFRNVPKMTPTISAHGRYVAFSSTATNLATGVTNHGPNVFVRDTVAHTTRLISVNLQGRSSLGGGELPAITADGRSVVFTSGGPDIVPGDTNKQRDVFVRTLARP